MPRQRTFRSRATINEERAALIAQALSTQEGRISLANASREPTRRDPNYSDVGGELFTLEPLPAGGLDRYNSIFNNQNQVK